MLKHGEGRKHSLQKRSGQLLMTEATGALFRSDGKGGRIGGMNTGGAMHMIESLGSILEEMIAIY